MRLAKDKTDAVSLPFFKRPKRIKDETLQSGKHLLDTASVLTWKIWTAHAQTTPPMTGIEVWEEAEVETEPPHRCEVVARTTYIIPNVGLVCGSTLLEAQSGESFHEGFRLDVDLSTESKQV